jgi:ABC-type nitrate/sulfonate/bicarbonate transport system ATPase subunit
MLDGNGIILLEEPEINLNSGVVEQLPEFIARMQRNKKRQVLVTTHSYDMLSSVGIGTAEVAVLETSPEGTKVSPLSEIPSLQAAVDAGFSIADAAIPAIKPSTANEMNTKL